MTTGEITSKADNVTTAARVILRRRVARTNTSKAIAQATKRSRGFTRTQQARPSNAPAPDTRRMLLCLAANSKSRTAPRTSQLVGESAPGVAPANASRGDNAARIPDDHPTPHPYAVAPIATTSRIDSESSTSWNRCTDAADLSPVMK